jgi:hypothetical protein
MAREVAAITGKRCAIPSNAALLPAPGAPVNVEIEDLVLPALQRAGFRKRHRAAFAALAAGRLTPSASIRSTTSSI